MASTLEIKRHIQSVRSISQVTHAMGVVSTARFRRLQARAESTRAFAERSWEVLSHLASAAEAEIRDNPMFSGYDALHCIGLIVMTSNRGMVGAYNHNVIALVREYAENLKNQIADIAFEALTIGKVGRNALLHLDYHIYADWELDDKVDITALTPIARAVLDGFQERAFEQVMIAYTPFRRGMRLQPRIQQLLPLAPMTPSERREYIYEPTPQELLLSLLPRIVRFQIYQAFLESLVAENMSRMTAMQSATQNAEHLVEQLTLAYNKARQQAITAELLDIIGGSAEMGSGGLSPHMAGF